MATLVPVRQEMRSAVPVAVAVVLGALLVLAGIANAGLSLAGTLWAQAPVEIGGAAPAWGEAVLPCVEGWSLDDLSGCGPAVADDVWPGGQPLPVQHLFGTLLVEVPPEAGPSAALLATAPIWSSLLAGGLGLLVLVPVLRTTAEGRPFAVGNERRFATAATVAATAWGLSIAGPYLAAGAAIRWLEATPRLSPDGSTYELPSGWLTADLRVAWWPPLLVVLLGCLAAATRRGARLAADVEGLV